MLTLRDSGVEPLPPSVIPDFVQANRDGMITFLVPAIALLYDSLCTFDKEVRYFWAEPLRWSSLLFFANRYAGIFGAYAAFYSDGFTANLRTCELEHRLVVQPSAPLADRQKFADWSRNAANFITIIAVDYMLFIRVVALYNKSRFLTIFFGLSLVGEAIFKMFIMVRYTLYEHITVVSIGDTMTSCATDNAAPFWVGIVDWSMPLIYGSILLAFALFKGQQYWREVGCIGSSLVRVLIVDQAIYYLATILCSVANIISFNAGSSLVVGNLFNGLGSPAFLCILGSRMMFNLKEAAGHGVKEGTNYTSYTMTNIGFRETVGARDRGQRMAEEYEEARLGTMQSEETCTEMERLGPS